jgi:hypothetical protein
VETCHEKIVHRWTAAGDAWVRIKRAECGCNHSVEQRLQWQAIGKPLLHASKHVSATQWAKK